MMSRPLALMLLLFAAACAQAQPAALAVGSMLPVQGHTVQHIGGGDAEVSSLLGARGTVFIFWSNACRWTDGYQKRVEDLHAAASSKGISVVLVNSNDASAFPEETPTASATGKHPVPYVHDPGAVLAKALGAYRTPEVFAFDEAGTLVYSGAIDDAPADAKAVQQSFVADFLAGSTPAPTKAFGCRIRFPAG